MPESSMHVRSHHKLSRPLSSVVPAYHRRSRQDLNLQPVVRGSPPGPEGTQDGVHLLHELLLRRRDEVLHLVQHISGHLGGLSPNESRCVVPFLHYFFCCCGIHWRAFTFVLGCCFGGRGGGALWRRGRGRERISWRSCCWRSVSDEPASAAVFAMSRSGRT